MTALEIILVDDLSTDNSLEVINELMFEDKRIRLIKNKEKKGKLYSRSIWRIKCKRKIYNGLS